jgi:hypothetical protein
MREVTVSCERTVRSRMGRGRRLALLTAPALIAIGVALVSQPLHADAPPGRYVVMTSTVVDSQTGLEWQSTVAPMALDWTDAVSYCSSLTLSGAGWRLPSITEAATIIDESRLNPALDPSAFPNTPVDVYWTASALSEYSGIYAWTISSQNGAITFFAATQLGHVRCVRSLNAGDASTGD